MKFRHPPLSLLQQQKAMQADFPALTFAYAKQRGKHIPTWRGTLQPSETSPVYRVKVCYRFPKTPQVWVLSPSLRPDAPHRYSDSSLCLYYPCDGSWTPHLPLSRTFVPWTALWLAFYEYWLTTGIWYGPEVAHAPAV
jgi:hypothetical protein